MHGIVGTTVAELESALNQEENSIEYGDSAKLQLVTDAMPSKQELSEFYDNMVSAGFHVSRPKSGISGGLSLTELVLTKGSPSWALLIPLIPTIMIMGLVAFGIIRIESISKALTPLLLIIGGTVIAIAAIVTRPSAIGVAEKAIERYGKR